MTNPTYISSADPATLASFDGVIDVRSPGEFADDHLPNAINLPVLDDDERARVGTIYVRESRFRARRIGAAIVARNISDHLENALSDRPADFRPLVYCWRGGQRSASMAIILAQIGWRTTVLEGGYRTYRRRVQTRLYTDHLPHRFCLLDGGTGCAKTEMLSRLSALGVQSLDLEALAGHRGSLFGGFEGQGQPGQKLFESRLLAQIEALDPSRPVVLEAESSKIGARVIPPALWKAMADAPCIELVAAPEQRANYLVNAYADIVSSRAALDRALARLPVYPGRRRLEELTGLAEQNDFEGLARTVIEHYYDPAYERSRKVRARPVLGVVEMNTISPEDQIRAAGEIAERLSRF
jgi:tRNA 2-selenouridine synthase